MDAALDDRGLRRIIAMLVSLAAIAERAACRSFPVRWLVLCLLRRGETVALQFVAEATQADWPRFDGDPQIGWRPEDAAALGLRFRMLAAVLATLLTPAGRPHHCTTGRGAPSRLAPPPQLFMPVGCMPEPADTS